VKGYGAAKPAGRPKKEKQNMFGTEHIKNGRGHSRANRADTLAARLAESTDPEIRKEWT
jgi:hypothetical protein